MFPEDEEDHISRLPMEILALIMSYLSLQEIKRLSEMSKLFYQVCHSEHLWRWLLRRDYGIQCEQLSLDGSGLMASEWAYKLAVIQNQEFKQLKKFHPLSNLGADSYEKYSDEQNCLVKRDTHLEQENQLIIELVMQGAQSHIYLFAKISRLPKSILEICGQSNFNICTLNLTSNHLSSLPLALFDLLSLYRLDLTDNNLCEISPFVAKLTNLTSLSLGNNRLTHLPMEMFTLTRLKVLDFGNYSVDQKKLNYNNLEQLPVQLGKLTELCFLGLNNLGLQAIPETLTKLRELQFLAVEDNPTLNYPHETVLALKKIKPDLQVRQGGLIQ